MATQNQFKKDINQNFVVALELGGEAPDAFPGFGHLGSSSGN